MLSISSNSDILMLSKTGLLFGLKTNECLPFLNFTATNTVFAKPFNSLPFQIALTSPSLLLEVKISLLSKFRVISSSFKKLLRPFKFCHQLLALAIISMIKIPSSVSKGYTKSCFNSLLICSVKINFIN